LLQKVYWLLVILLEKTVDFTLYESSQLDMP